VCTMRSAGQDRARLGRRGHRLALKAQSQVRTCSQAPRSCGSPKRFDRRP
jgi:hypothetical protein